jgi:hypothetical protein
VDGVTSSFHLRESLDSLYEFRVENNIRAFSARFAVMFHGLSRYTLYVYGVYAICRDDSMPDMAICAGQCRLTCAQRKSFQAVTNLLARGQL